MMYLCPMAGTLSLLKNRYALLQQYYTHIDVVFRHVRCYDTYLKITLLSLLLYKLGTLDAIPSILCPIILMPILTLPSLLLHFALCLRVVQLNVCFLAVHLLLD